MKKLFFVFISALLLISSCGNGEEPGADSSGAFVGGVNGISFSFVEGAPFNEFAAGQDIPVKISLKNGGEYDLVSDSLEVRLWGLDMGAYGLSSDYKKVNSELRGLRKGFQRRKA